jgi:hypothetical protein
MQIWTNEASEDKLRLEYEFIDNKLYSADLSTDEKPEAKIEQNKKEDCFNILLEDKKIKLNYLEAHHLFLLLLCEITLNEDFKLKVQIIEPKIIKEI